MNQYNGNNTPLFDNNGQQIFGNTQQLHLQPHQIHQEPQYHGHEHQHQLQNQLQQDANQACMNHNVNFDTDKLQSAQKPAYVLPQALYQFQSPDPNIVHNMAKDNNDTNSFSCEDVLMALKSTEFLNISTGTHAQALQGLDAQPHDETGNARIVNAFDQAMFGGDTTNMLNKNNVNHRSVIQRSNHNSNNNANPELTEMKPAQSNATTRLQQQQTNTKTDQYHQNSNATGPYVEIVEQPAKHRFRYMCEGRAAGSLQGANSTKDHKTYPSIKIHNYVGKAVVVISAVTKDAPYRAHPHGIVGKEGTSKKEGFYTIKVNNEPNMLLSFSGLGIQSATKWQVQESLKARESKKLDPFKVGFNHKFNLTKEDLKVLRLCFQVFIEDTKPGIYDCGLKPVVSDPIYDKKALSDLVIEKMSHNSAPVSGDRDVMVFCNKVSKEDLKVRFFEERNGDILWEAYVQPYFVHKQMGFCFKTPKYCNENISRSVDVYVQLHRPSDGNTSEPRPFKFYTIRRRSVYNLN